MLGPWVVVEDLAAEGAFLDVLYNCSREHEGMG